MVRVKICGIRREADVLYVNKHLPDYIGFIFAKSKRQVSTEYAQILAGALDTKIKKGGVFVNEELEVVLEVASRCSLDVIQIHGDEDPGYIEALKSRLDSGIQIWKAVRVKDADSVKRISEYSADAYVLDSYVEGSYGGAGKTFDWSLAVDAKKHGDIILAGGLSLLNVKDAIGIVQPFAVDISSGVETDGFKDEEKIRDFVEKVRGHTHTKQS